MTGRRERREWGSKRIAGTVGILCALASCSHSAPNYCEAEGRVIPELEWKARALVALQNKGEQHIPLPMLRFVKQRLSALGSDVAAQKIFIEYIEKHPLCCQIDYSDRYGRLETEYDVPSDELLEVGPKATLYLLGSEESKFMDLDERDRLKSKNRSSGSPAGAGGVPEVFIHAGISSCGDKVAVWNIGGGRYVGK